MEKNEQNNEDNQNIINNINNEENDNTINRINSNNNRFRDSSMSSEISLNEENRKTINSLISHINNNNEIVKLGSKILCPQENCFLNSIININPFLFTINSDCGKHQYTMDILDYIIKSGIIKEDKDICNFCEKTYLDLKNNNKNFYKCKCGQNICEECKKSHLKGNLEEHNLIDYNVKDFTCPCNNKGKKFTNYCFDCKLNFCTLCSNEHKDHDKKNIVKFIM